MTNRLAFTREWIASIPRTINNNGCCGSEYRTHINKTGWNRGRVFRFCAVCNGSRNAKS